MWVLSSSGCSGNKLSLGRVDVMIIEKQLLKAAFPRWEHLPVQSRPSKVPKQLFASVFGVDPGGNPRPRFLGALGWLC